MHRPNQGALGQHPRANRAAEDGGGWGEVWLQGAGRGWKTVVLGSWLMKDPHN